MATEAPRFKYRVVGANSLIASEGKDYKEGMELELPKHVAVNFRHQLEAIDDGGKLDAPVSDTDKFMARLGTFRDHEKKQELEAEKARLEAALDTVDAELERIDKASRPTPAAEAAPKGKAAK